MPPNDKANIGVKHNRSTNTPADVNPRRLRKKNINTKERAMKNKRFPNILTHTVENVTGLYSILSN